MFSDRVAEETISVGMGQAVVGRPPTKLTAVLGSCLGICLWHPRSRVGGMAHTVLPQSNGQPSQVPGKFVDTAIRFLQEKLQMLGVPSDELVAKLAGGACMFPTNGPLQIGEANIEKAIKCLQAASIPVVAQDVAGTKGRRIVFDLATGRLLVQVVGESPRML
ncbi:MAG: chemotaxis protein CheD [Thermoguttaceae bacterium]|nr:chemotaxis protein CheD [Thermoguttaceae bacterium]MDW8078744.1 chemotaxis protein CheD [Thermoguttaceae bacterium]